MTKSKTTPATTECLQANLAKALSIVGRASASRSTLPVLANILMRAMPDGRLMVRATNLEISITAYIGSKNTEAWDITLPSKALTEITNALPDSAMTLELRPKTVETSIRAGSFVSVLKGIDASEFPLIPDVVDGFDLPSIDLKKALAEIIFCALTEDSRPVLTGILAESDGQGHLHLSAADGFRLGQRSLAVAPPVPPFKVIIPARACAELERILTDDVVRVSLFGEERIGFRCGSVEIVAQLIEGAYPDLNTVVPKSFDKIAVVEVKALHQAARAAEIFARESARTVRLSLTPGSDQQAAGLALHATGAELGEHHSFVLGTIEGQALDIALNVRFLIELLNAVDTPALYLKFNNATSPILANPVGRDDYHIVIMPMSLGK